MLGAGRDNWALDTCMVYLLVEFVRFRVTFRYTSPGIPAVLWCCFFFQAEDGIRDADVTGVQTCALPICWGYNALVQFLASRGYAVLQPQFRGTNGFGANFLAAGFRKWGDEMQDDLEDGVK